MGFFSTIGAFGKRSMIGAGVGAGLGFANTGDLGGVIGGAAAGGAAFGFGGGYMRGLNYAGGMRSGLQMARKGSVGIEKGAWRRFEKFGGTSYGNALGRTALGMNSIRGSLGTARSFIGQNAVAVNKWGGRAASAAGIGAAAYIGSSVIGSNRGY